MLVKFSNAEVPVWKLRKGVVVKLKENDTFYHVRSLGMDYKNSIEIGLSGLHDKMVIFSEELIWLED